VFSPEEEGEDLYDEDLLDEDEADLDGGC